MAFTALLDADVLFRIALTDLLLTAADRRFYRPAWSERILEEASRNVKKSYPSIPAVDIDTRFADMRRAFPAAAITGYEALIPRMRNDPKDRHVLAAAVVGRADVIVTYNLKHFPTTALAPYEIEAQDPDEFCRHLWHLDPDVVVACLDEIASKRKRGRWDARTVLLSLGASAPAFVADALSSGRIP